MSCFRDVPLPDLVSFNPGTKRQVAIQDPDDPGVKTITTLVEPCPSPPRSTSHTYQYLHSYTLILTAEDGTPKCLDGEFPSGVIHGSLLTANRSALASTPPALSVVVLRDRIRRWAW